MNGGGKVLLRVWDVTFTVSDLRRSIDYYENVLGLAKKYEFETYAGFDCGGVEIGLVPGRTSKVHSEEPCVDFLVRDLDEAYGVLRARGVRFVKEPHGTQWGGRIALFTDPDGHLLQLVQINWSEYFAACAPK